MSAQIKLSIQVVVAFLLALGKRFYQSLLRETSLSWQFIRRDISSTIIPGVLFMVAAWNSHPSPFSELVLALGHGLVYFWLFILPFCVANQISGIEEDRLNKPDRPLVTEAVSLQGARVRWAISMVLFSLVGWWFGVLEWALLWQGCIILSNFVRLGDHWSTKNLMIGIGVFAQLAAAWQMNTPLTLLTWRWIAVAGIVWMILGAVQDLRDIDGDRAIGRNTFPIAFGESASRVLLSLGFGLLPLVTHIFLFAPAGNTWNAILCDIVLASVSWSIAARIVGCRSPKADHHTYMLFTYWYCLVLVSAILVL